MSADRWQRVENKECKTYAETVGFRAWSTHGFKLNPYPVGREADRADWERGWRRASELAEYEDSISR